MNILQAEDNGNEEARLREQNVIENQSLYGGLSNQQADVNNCHILLQLSSRDNVDKQEPVNDNVIPGQSSNRDGSLIFSSYPTESLTVRAGPAKSLTVITSSTEPVTIRPGPSNTLTAISGSIESVTIRSDPGDLLNIISGTTESSPIIADFSKTSPAKSNLSKSLPTRPSSTGPLPAKSILSKSTTIRSASTGSQPVITGSTESSPASASPSES